MPTEQAAIQHKMLYSTEGNKMVLSREGLEVFALPLLEQWQILIFHYYMQSTFAVWRTFSKAQRIERHLAPLTLSEILNNYLPVVPLKRTAQA